MAGALPPASPKTAGNRQARWHVWLDARWTITRHGDAGSQGRSTNLSMLVAGGPARIISAIEVFNSTLSFVSSAGLRNQYHCWVSDRGSASSPKHPFWLSPA